MILLDTCALLWSANQEPLSPAEINGDLTEPTGGDWEALQDAANQEPSRRRAGALSSDCRVGALSLSRVRLGNRSPRKPRPNLASSSRGPVCCQGVLPARREGGRLDPGDCRQVVKPAGQLTPRPCRPLTHLNSSGDGLDVGYSRPSYPGVWRPRARRGSGLLIRFGLTILPAGVNPASRMPLMASFANNWHT